MIGFISFDAAGLGKFKSELVFDSGETGADFGIAGTGTGLVCTGEGINLPSASNSIFAGACGTTAGFTGIVTGED
jgi:hypothetical protein